MRLSNTQRFGSIVEAWAADELTKRGWHVRMMPNFFESFDLLIDGFLPCEVKASKPYSQHAHGNIFRQRWQFDLRRGLGRGINARTQDFLYVLVAVDDNGELFPYIVPSAWTVDRSKTPSVTSHPKNFRGWLAEGLENWSNVHKVYGWRRKFLDCQPALFDLAEVAQ